MLYKLILTDLELSYDNFSEDFHIGLFETERQAEDTALYYLKNIKGFCDFPCTYRIVKRRWLAASTIVTLILYGWCKDGT